MNSHPERGPWRVETIIPGQDAKSFYGRTDWQDHQQSARKSLSALC
jgi:hypothetical protein